MNVYCHTSSNFGWYQIRHGARIPYYLLSSLDINFSKKICSSDINTTWWRFTIVDYRTVNNQQSNNQSNCVIYRHTRRGRATTQSRHSWRWRTLVSGSSSVGQHARLWAGRRRTDSDGGRGILCSSLHRATSPAAAYMPWSLHQR